MFHNRLRRFVAAGTSHIVGARSLFESKAVESRAPFSGSTNAKCYAKSPIADAPADSKFKQRFCTSDK